MGDERVEIVATLRRRVIELLQLYASAGLVPERERTIVHDAAEMCCMWFDDLFDPGSEDLRAAFSATEWARVVWFHARFDERSGTWPDDIEFDALLVLPSWRAVAADAQALLEEFGWGAHASFTSDHRVPDVTRGVPVTVVFDGREVQAFEGESLAMALWAGGVRGIRGSSRVGEARGVFCNMGICYECLVDVGGEGAGEGAVGGGRAVRACMEPVVGPRMVVTSRRPPS